jgi:hypothetical protein
MMRSLTPPAAWSVTARLPELARTREMLGGSRFHHHLSVWCACPNGSHAANGGQVPNVTTAPNNTQRKATTLATPAMWMGSFRHL